MTTTITLGRYVVRVAIRVDNPAFPSYLIYRGETFIGKQFSVPSESDCQWLERYHGLYASESHRPEISDGRPIRGRSKPDLPKWDAHKRRRGRPKNKERDSRDTYLALQPDEALVE